MTRSVIVTGAAGYIGKHVVRELLDMGARVVAIDRNGVALDERASVVQADLDEVDGKTLEQLGLPDACLHLAWTNGFDHNARSHLQNLSSHFRFLTRMADAGVKQLTVLGTMHEVGYWEGAIDERTPTNPRSLYGVAKNTLRQALEIEFSNTDVILQWVRAYYILGDFARGRSIFSKILSWEEEGRKTFPFNSGTNKYDFIAVTDLARQIAATTLQTEINGIVNCCSGNPVALKDKVEEFLAENRLKIRPQYGAYPDRAYDSPAIWGDVDKIQAIMAARKAGPV
jgi:nucleoside-diphosphate-sugar epimerase